MIKNILIQTIIIAFLSVQIACKNNHDAQTVEENPTAFHNEKPAKGVVHSKDTFLLGKLVDLQTYRPDSVVFQISGLEADSIDDNTAHQKKIHLQAVLYYEEHVYARILEQYMDVGFPKGDYTKDDFRFDWLDDLVKAELELSQEGYKGNPDIFLGTNGEARLWFLNKKIVADWVKEDKVLNTQNVR